MQTRTWGIGVVRALGLFLLLSVIACQRADQGQVIKIGSSGPLSGPQADLGQQLLNGARLAVDEANAAGGVLGAKVELVAMDDKADPKEAVSVANKLVADSSVVAVVGNPNSGTALPASPVYHQNGMPFVIAAATNPKITQQGFREVFRICPTDDMQGPQAANFAIEELKKTRIALLHDKSPYGQGLVGQFKKEAKRLGITSFVEEATITAGDSDFSAVLTSLKEKNPDLIYFGGMYPEGGLLLRQSGTLGIKATFMGGDGSFDPQVIQVAGNAAEGAIFSFIAPPWDKIPEAKDFSDKYRARHSEIGAFSPYGYDSVNVVISALKKAGKVDRQAIIEALRAPDFSYKGVTGTIRFDEKGDAKDKRLYFYVVKDEKFELWE